MSLFAKIVTGIFGRKTDKDIKILTPYIDLINSVPTLDAKLVKNELDSETPKYSEFGCNYVNRCNKAMDVCAIKKPNLKNYKKINHQISCHLYTTQN